MVKPLKYILKAFVFKGSPLTAADLGSFLNSVHLASCGKFKQEPKSAAVKKKTPLARWVINYNGASMALHFVKF